MSWHGYLQPLIFSIFNRKNFRKSPFQSFFVGKILRWRKFQKNRSRNSFSFIFEGKLLNKIILKVRKNGGEKKFSSGWKFKSRNGGANLSPPPSGLTSIWLYEYIVTTSFLGMNSSLSVSWVVRHLRSHPAQIGQFLRKWIELEILQKKDRTSRFRPRWTFSSIRLEPRRQNRTALSRSNR